MLVLSPRIGQLAGRRGPRLFMTLGPMGIAAGLLLLTRLSPDSTYLAELLPGVVVLGLATTVAPLTDTVVSAVPEGRAGVAAAFNNVVAARRCRTGRQPSLHPRLSLGHGGDRRRGLYCGAGCGGYHQKCGQVIAGDIPFWFRIPCSSFGLTGHSDSPAFRRPSTSRSESAVRL